MFNGSIASQDFRPQSTSSLKLERKRERQDGVKEEKGVETGGSRTGDKTPVQSGIQQMLKWMTEQMREGRASAEKRVRDVEGRARSLLESSALQNKAESRPANTLKLHKVELPKFEGDLKQWPIFWELFKATVDNQTCLNDAEKMRYLVMKLARKPMAVVDGLQHDPKNYQSMKQALEKRYGQPKDIVKEHLQRLRDLPHIPEEDMACIQEFADTLESWCRSLQSLLEMDESGVCFVLEQLGR